MADFHNYRDDERQRRGLLLAGALGIGAAFAIPVVRREATKLMLGGVAKLGRRFGRGLSPLRLQSTARELEGLLSHTLPEAARASLAAERATADLAAALGRSGAENAALHARQLATTTAFQRFLNTGFRRDLQRAMAHEEVRGIIGRHVADVARLAPGQALDQILNRQTQLIEDTLRQVTRPTLQEAASLPATQVARQEIQRLAGQHLEQLAAPSRMDRVLGFFGVRRVTLGNRFGRALAQPGGPLEETRRLLLQHGSEELIKKLPVGGIFRVGDQGFDLTGAQDLLNRVGDWFSQNFQIPVAPGMRGIAPGQLFPWRRGRIPREFAHAAQFGRDPVGAAIFGSATDRMGMDLFKVGDAFLGARLTRQGGMVGELGIDADLYSGLYGFIKRRSMVVNAAQKARAAGLNNLTDLFFNRHWQQTELGEKLSTLTKFRDPRWAPNLFAKISGGDLSTVTAEELERASHFLTSRELPRRVQESLAAEASFGNKVLTGHAQNLLTDEGVLGFFQVAANDPDELIKTLKSGRLKSRIRQFQSSSAATLAAGRPSVDFDALFSGVTGIRGDKRGLDIMRADILDELVSQRDDEFLDWARGLGLKGGDLTDTLAYGHGKQLASLLNKKEGLTLAANYLRESAQTRREVGEFVRRHVKPWDTFRQPDQETLNTAELLVPRGRNLAVELISAINEARKAGENPLNAVVRVVKSPAVGQFSAFFTGNQADVTATTLAMEYIPRRLEQYFQTAGLGLPERDLLSGGSILTNLMLKRILPVVAAYEGYRYADYKLHQSGLNGPSDLYANIRSRVGLERAKLTGGNFLGLGRRELFPGLEKLIPDRTVEEEQEFQQSGYEPVRRGRFWLVGSRNPFFGDRVSYFLPSAVQVTRSHWQEAENVDLNTRDYWSHSFLPLPENHFLGPLNWLTDRYWFERKHSEGPNADRPYLVSGEMFDPAAAHGPLANATVGRLLKPQRILHPEYLPKSLGGSASREQLRALNEAQKAGADVRGVGLLAGGGTGAGGGMSAGLSRHNGGINGGIGSPGVLVGDSTGETHGSIAAITAGGQLSPLSLPGDMTQDQWQNLGKSTIQGHGGSARLSRRELERINRMTKAGTGGLAKIRPSAVTRMYDQVEPFSDEDLDLVNYQSGGVQMLDNIGELSGLYGFLGRRAAAAAGFPLQQPGIPIATPSRAYGFARRLHDLGLGSFGEGVTEVFRRFVNKPPADQTFNPVPNMMPSWLPGPEYFTDFRHGDPWAKIPRGELRLPGEAYERLHHPALLRTRASSIGKSVPEIMQQMLFIEQPLSDSGAEATEVGTAMHRALQRRWKRMGILVGAEERIEDPSLGISGHYDAILNMGAGNTLVDIKTVNQRRFEQAERHPFAEHVSQLNFYLHETGVHQGALIYVNRDKPWEVATQNVGYNPGLFRRDVAKVREARRRILDLVQQGTLTRGDLYDPITRFEILADVAPYSENYASLRQYLTQQNESDQLTEAENRRFQAAKKRVAIQKKDVDVTPYRFKNAAVDYQTVTVEKILDPNTLLIRGSDHPLRLAGVRSSNARIEETYGEAPEGVSPAEWQFQQFGIKPGSRVRVALEADPAKRIADDVLQTQHAVLFRGGVNINKALLEAKVAREKETDYSSTGVTARFTPDEIQRGRIWEKLAHADTFLNTKFLRVRSPLEELERGIVFGKNSGSWAHPFRDYFWPSVTSFVSHNPLAAGLGLGGFASLFMRTKKGKLAAALGGFVVGAGASLLRHGEEQVSGKTWKPIRTRRREELEEYWDILKYVKYRGLSAAEAKLAKKVENVDVEAISRELFNEGEQRKRKRNWLEKRKRELIIDEARHNQDHKEELDKLQDQIERTQEQQGMLKLGPHATRALQYRELYRSTLYGIEPGTTPFLNIFRAMPKYKRELLQGWVEKSDHEEQERIYDLLPRQEQRVLGRYLNIDPQRIPDRPLLSQFFRNHSLPGPNWAGWSADVDLEKMREVAIKSERLDPAESGINDRMIEDAEREIGNVPVPTLHGNSSAIQAKLNEVLSGRGLTNVRVNVAVSPHDGDRDTLNIQMNIKHHRERDIMNALQTG